MTVADDRAIPARFDDARAAMLHFTRTSDTRVDSAPLVGVARLDVTRGKRKNPTRAFWGPIVGGTAGFALGVLPACLRKGAGNLCGLAAIVLGSIPGTIIGTWWGLRDVPRWVNLPLTP